MDTTARTVLVVGATSGIGLGLAHRFAAAGAAVVAGRVTARVIDASTPHLVDRGDGDVITVISGIAFMPLPLMASHGASTAGVHADTEALRAQLETFLDEVMDLLAADPTPQQVVVEAAQKLRWAERDGTYTEQLARRSASLSTLPGR